MSHLLPASRKLFPAAVSTRCLLSLLGLAHAAAPVQIRGVSPEDLPQYVCEHEPCTFRCLHGSQEALPMEAVNDDFCDCKDGSDEPGTGACGGQDTTLFFCPNVGGVPRKIYVSRVDDGICDCCDGSDEAGARGSKSCSNNCEQEKQERERLLERLQRGLEKHKEGRREAKNTRQRWRKEIDSLKVEILELEQQLENAKVAAAAQAMPEPVAARFDEVMEVIVKMQAQIKELQRSQEELIMENLELRELLGRSSRHLAKDAGERDRPPVVQKSTDVAEVPEKKASQEAEAAAPAKEEKVVSEYAKWMDKSAQVLTEESTTTTTTSTSSLPRPAKALDAAAQSAALDANSTELQQKIDKSKARISDLEAKMALVTDDKLAYFPLMDTCLQSESFNGHTYSICFFASASQAGGTQGNVSLGSWAGWKSQRQVSFTGGKSCGSVNRQLLVKFRCAEETKIVDVTEPGHCSYEAIVHAPGACSKKAREEIEKGDPSVRLPKDEL